MKLMATFCERFKSYYLSEHCYTAWGFDHIPLEKIESDRLVNVEESAKKHPPPEGIIANLGNVLSKEVYQKMGEGEFEGNRAFYEKHGFRVLKAFDTLVLEHKNLPGYLIKAAMASRVFYRNLVKHPYYEEVPLQHTNLLRAKGRAHYDGKSTDTMFTFPKEYLYTYQDPTDKELHRRFFAISEKVDVFNPEESIEKVKRLKPNKQIEIAKRVCKFIKKTGFTDMHDGNLLLRKDLQEWTFCLIDLEPLGLFIEANEPNKESLASHEELVFEGLICFRDFYCRKNGLTEMAHHVDHQIERFVEDNQEKLKGMKAYEGGFNGGIFIDKAKEFDRYSVLLILLTIPFFWIVLPILSIRAACSAPPEEELA
ncbi:MAG: hypothetical protein JJU12_05275 [Chlamydiales bacterium]|nr:hypothetical protein [Chlamydiales bacterium]